MERIDFVLNRTGIKPNSSSVLIISSIVTEHTVTTTTWHTYSRRSTLPITRSYQNERVSFKRTFKPHRTQSNACNVYNETVGFGVQYVPRIRGAPLGRGKCRVDSRVVPMYPATVADKIDRERAPSSGVRPKQSIGRALAIIRYETARSNNTVWTSQRTSVTATPRRCSTCARRQLIVVRLIAKLMRYGVGYCWTCKRRGGSDAYGGWGRVLSRDRWTLGNRNF